MQKNVYSDKIKKYINLLDNSVSLWLKNNIEYFNFNNKIYTGKSLDDRMKPFCELAFLTNFMRKDNNTYSIIRRFLIDNIIKINWDEFIYRNSDMFNAIIALDSFYIENEKKSIFNEIDIAEISKLYLKVPYRMMEIETYLCLYNNKDKKSPYFEDKTVIGKRKNINKFTYDDIYSLTHEVFYLYFLIENNKKENFLEEVNFFEIKEYLFNFLVFTKIDGHIDLMIEIIICIFLLNFKLKSNEIYILENSLEFIMKYVLEDGSVIPHIIYLNKTDLKFIDVYHTTIIMKGLIDVCIKMKF